MKVNITGFGTIPRIGILAPAYNVEMDQQGVRRMMNFPEFRVFDAETGTIITRKNINDVLASKQVKKPATEEKPKKQQKATETSVVEETPVIETPVAEEVEEVKVEVSTYEETEAVNDESEIIEDVIDTTAAVVDTDEAPQVQSEDRKPQNYHKNKKRR